MLNIIINGETVASFDTNTRYPGVQRRFLDTMDLDMDQGFELDEQFIKKPDEMERAKYVAMSLIVALQNNNNEMVNAMGAYLANRLPDLKQVRATDSGNDVEMDLLFTELN